MKCGDATNPGGIGYRANGDPCGNTVVEGTYRCHMHGGKSPAAKAKAEQAMALLRMPATEALYNVITTLNKIIERYREDTCAACGYPRGDVEEIDTVVKAARSLAQSCAAILDRTGLGPKSTLEVRQSDGDLDLKALTDMERDEMMRLLGMLDHLKQSIKDRIHGPAPTSIM